MTTVLIIRENGIYFGSNKMTDEWNRHYDKLKAEIDVLTVEEKNKRIEDLGKEVFILANSFAGNKTGDIAVQLHKASNAMSKASLMIEGDADKLARHEMSEMMSMQEEMTYNILKLTRPEMFLDED
jgi:hypothetical protein